MTERDKERFFKFYSEDEQGHGLWSGTVNRHGYGMFWMGSCDRMIEAYRVAYHSLVDDVEEGLELLHIYPGDTCASWLHVRPSTHADNQLERAGATLERCKNGHLRKYNGALETAKSTGKRCRGCLRMRNCKNQSRPYCPDCGSTRYSTEQICLACNEYGIPPELRSAPGQ